MELKEALLKRRSIRKFKKDKISDELINELLIASMSGPSACNKCPWEFYVVTNEDLLEQFKQISVTTNMDAPLAIIACGNLDNALAGSASEFWIQDSSAAIENILLRVTDLSLGACWCGIHPRIDRVNKVKELLNLTDNIIPLGLLYIGYPNEEKEERTQLDLSKVHFIK